MFSPRAFQDAVLTRVEYVPHVGDVLHIAHLITFETQVAGHYVKGDVGFGVAQVGVIVDGGSTHIHPHLTLDQGNKFFFLTS